MTHKNSQTQSVPREQPLNDRKAQNGKRRCQITTAHTTPYRVLYQRELNYMKLLYYHSQKRYPLKSKNVVVIRIIKKGTILSW